MIGVQWTLLLLCLQKRSRIAPDSTTACRMLWDVPVLPTALLIFRVVFPAKFIQCQMLLTLLSPQLMQMPDFHTDLGFIKSSKKLSSLLQVCRGWQGAELQQGKQEGSCSTRSHDAWKAKKQPSRQESDASIWRFRMPRVSSATQRCGRWGF